MADWFWAGMIAERNDGAVKELKAEANARAECLRGTLQFGGARQPTGGGGGREKRWSSELPVPQNRVPKVCVRLQAIESRLGNRGMGVGAEGARTAATWCRGTTYTSCAALFFDSGKLNVATCLHQTRLRLLTQYCPCFRLPSYHYQSRIFLPRYDLRNKH